MTSNPVVHMDISLWGEEIAANLQLLQDRVKTETYVRMRAFLSPAQLTRDFHLDPKERIITSCDGCIGPRL